MTTTIDVRRADTRPRTALPWLDWRHSFSFGRHYDATNTHHGLRVVSNDDVVRAGTGSSTHPHRRCRSSPGCSTASSSTRTPPVTEGCSIRARLAQRMSAGTGIWHSEPKC